MPFRVHRTADKAWMPLVTAIELSVYRNAKPQLGTGNLPTKLGLGVPSRADLTLNVS